MPGLKICLILSLGQWDGRGPWNKMKIKIIYALILLVGLNLSGCQQSSEEIDITADQFLNLDDTSDAIILDVRTDSEFQGGHLENAIFLNMRSSDFKEKIEKLDKQKTYYVYCRSGVRSKSVVKMMREEGFQGAFNVKGGIKQLTRNGLNLVK